MSRVFIAVFKLWGLELGIATGAVSDWLRESMRLKIIASLTDD